MNRIAIPIFRGKVSPVFDSCTRVLLVDIDNKRAADRKELYLDALSLTERLTLLNKTGVTAVVCGGISSVMERMIVGAKIELISNIVGKIEDVLDAYLSNELGLKQYHMPGTPGGDSHKRTHTGEISHEKG